ncbi:hypothetical protein M408DRAFT_277228 [Serendipita vermifera MAFF 305830]|uniref:WH1 domain-containing protein n=1 Tax=Serendipita vermifera MAFF 305830 TaxID=933852 RepID=A0A0C2X038_SERVB|nr:hypothetical protein M408DRAFT_168110 [Serendipita vermifera MAFF 305830]KIM22912.1 hypothetical protein M408DRAFT_277228 [Serendipita vermifera MAFF 305830]
MPTLSTISSDDKSRIKTSIPSSNSKILTATLARVYCAHPDPNSWAYAGLQGALALTMDKNSGGFGFKLVDLLGTRGVIWEHEIWEPFEYHMDRPFFHSFAGDECMIGLVFADESEARTMYKKVTSRKQSSGMSSRIRPCCARTSLTHGLSSQIG